ncbi:MAG: hypothetical protein P8N52_04935 [Crocinitomicaceae bacterium]|nr:hypothetical protein [Crocinitomicaceae bacterium]
MNSLLITAKSLEHNCRNYINRSALLNDFEDFLMSNFNDINEFQNRSVDEFRAFEMLTFVLIFDRIYEPKSDRSILFIIKSLAQGNSFFDNLQKVINLIDIEDSVINIERDWENGLRQLFKNIKDIQSINSSILTTKGVSILSDRISTKLISGIKEALSQISMEPALTPKIIAFAQEFNIDMAKILGWVNYKNDKIEDLSELINWDF